MKRRLERNMKIIEELVGFCYKNGGEKIDISLDCRKEFTNIEISAHVKNISEETIKEVSKTLNVERQHEVEEYYWFLNGEDNLGEELSLVGVMIDTAKVNYQDEILSIKINRLG